MVLVRVMVGVSLAGIILALAAAVLVVFDDIAGLVRSALTTPLA